ncbi:VWA domain-containing protein [Candidatus Falkowbacteria bacterium]|nr:VWA domain-containing protein [Candidatus Falkowbacteria bacterium]MBT7500413.1 VWA domain-containing protein [Candidatus Falkowbacteria bacterium]
MSENTQQQEEAMGKPIPALPLKEMEIRGVVNGTESEMEVCQTYGNELDKPVEAIYVFPLVDEASVLGVTMQIGDKRIESELRTKQEARDEYEEARDDGHHAALLEQERPNIFTMSVAGIEPGETISVTARYFAPVSWQDDGGRFSAPLVVAPRFIPGVPKDGEPQGDGWAPDTNLVPDASKITPQVVEEVSYKASLEIFLTPGFPATIESPSHQELIEATQLEGNGTHLIKAENLRMDRDIVITYKTTAKQPNLKVDNTIVTVGEGETEEFTLLQLTAGLDQTATSPIEVMLCLDRSGSMSGPKIEGLKVITRKLLEKFRASTRPTKVGIMIFDYEDQFELLVRLSEVTEEHFSCLKNFNSRGSTYLGQALTQCMKQFDIPARGDNIERCVIAVSDGQTHDDSYVKKAGVRVHTIGIDSAVNNDTLKSFAKESDGQNECVLPGEDYTAVANQMANLASGPVIQNISILELPDDAEMIGSTSLFSNRPATIAIRSKKFEPRRLIVQGQGVDGQTHEWPLAVPEESTSDMGSWMWAKMKMRELTDDKAKTELSLRYGIIGPTTSFVAVSYKDIPGEKPEKVDIPVLLPHTWDYDATFGSRSMAGAAMIGMLSSRRSTVDNMKFFSGGVNLQRQGLTPSGGEMHSLDSIDDASESFCDDIRYLSGELRLPDEYEDPLQLPSPPQQLTDKPTLLQQAEDLKAKLEKHTDRSVTDKLWIVLQMGLTTEKFTDWPEIQLSSLYNLLVELRAYGYTTTIPSELIQQPTEEMALALWTLAEQGLGKATAIST